VTVTGRLGLLIDNAYARLALGDLHAAQGDIARARSLFGIGLHLVRVAGDRSGEAKLLLRLAQLLGTERRFDEAVALAERAERMCSDIGNPTAGARALAVLGELHLASGNQAAAMDAWLRSRALYQDAGSDYAADIGRRLADLPR
jgi:tetratricopeptide (TPR) repeat protein